METTLATIVAIHGDRSDHCCDRREQQHYFGLPVLKLRYQDCLSFSVGLFVGRFGCWPASSARHSSLCAEAWGELTHSWAHPDSRWRPALERTRSWIVNFRRLKYGLFCPIIMSNSNLFKAWSILQGHECFSYISRGTKCAFMRFSAVFSHLVYRTRLSKTHSS